MRKRRQGLGKAPTTTAGVEGEIIQPDPIETDEGALEWLVEFVNTDIAVLPEREEFSFCFSAMTFSGDQQGQHEIEPSGDWDDRDETGRRMRVTGRIPSLESLGRLQREVRDGLARLAEGLTWQLPAVPRKWFLEPMEAESPRLGYVGTPETTFVARVAALVTRRWDELRRCRRSDCRAWFRRRRRQEYCSARCSGLVRQDRFRKRNPKRRRDHPAEYQRRMRTRLGANVRTARRRVR